MRRSVGIHRFSLDVRRACLSEIEREASTVVISIDCPPQFRRGGANGRNDAAGFNGVSGAGLPASAVTRRASNGSRR